MNIYDSRIGEENKILIDPATTAFLIGLATKMLEGFAVEFGRSFGQTLGKGLADYILSLIGGGGGGFSYKQLEKLLQQYADYIIREIRLIIKEGYLESLNGQVLSENQTFIERMIAKDNNRNLYKDLIKTINTIIQNAHDLAVGTKGDDGEFVSLRGVCLGVFINASLLKINIHMKLISIELIEEKDPQDEIAALELGIRNHIEPKLELLKELIREDFGRRVDVKEYQGDLLCEIFDPPVTVLKLDRRKVKAIQLTVDGKVYVGYEQSCKGESGDYEKVREMGIKAKSDNMAKFEREFNAPIETFKLALNELYKQAKLL